MAYMLCPHCGQELQHIKIRTETETLTLAELLARLKELEELVEDTVFCEAMQEVAAEEGRRAIEENERLKADPELAMPEETHKRMMEFLCNSVAGSMALSGMPLTAEDKERLRLAADNPAAAEKIVQQLKEKHTRLMVKEDQSCF